MWIVHDNKKDDRLEKFSCMNLQRMQFYIKNNSLGSGIDKLKECHSLSLPLSRSGNFHFKGSIKEKNFRVEPGFL